MHSVGIPIAAHIPSPARAGDAGQLTHTTFS